MARSNDDILRELEAAENSGSVSDDDILKQLEEDSGAAATAGSEAAVVHASKTGEELDAGQQVTAGKWRNRGMNILERYLGGAAYGLGRGQQMAFWALAAQDKDAFDKLVETMPSGAILPGDVETALAHGQLDLLEDNTRQAGGAWWDWDTEPMIMERMEADLRGEHFTVLEYFGGDWNAYEEWKQDAKWYERAGMKQRELTIDMVVDPLAFVGEAYSGIKGVFSGAKWALRGARVGKDVAKAERLLQAVRVTAKTGVTELVAHADNLDALARELAEKGPGFEDALNMVMKRKAELERYIEGRKAESTPLGRVHSLYEAQAEAVKPTAKSMTKSEVARRAELAAEHADEAEVTEAIQPVVKPKPKQAKKAARKQARMKAEGKKPAVDATEEETKGAVEAVFGSVEDLRSQLDDLAGRIADGTATEGDMRTLKQLDALPENIRNYLDKMGVSAERTRRAGALRSGIDDMVDGTDEVTMAQRELLGPDDGEMAADGIKKLVLGAEPEDILVHDLDMLEYNNLKAGESMIRPDGVWIREMPKIARRVEDVEQFSTLSGRAMPGYSVGSRVMNVARQMGGFLERAWSGTPMAQPVAYVPEVARLHRQGELAYKLMYNESRTLFREMMSNLKLIRTNRRGVMELTRNGAKVLREALEGKPKSAQAQQLHEWLATWVNKKAADIGIHGGKPATTQKQLFDMPTTLKQLLPHLTPPSKGNRVLEYVGLSAEANLRWLKHGELPDDPNSLLNLMDFLNRAVHRKALMEPTFEAMASHIDDLMKAGKSSKAAFAGRYLASVKGQPKSLFSHIADRLPFGTNSPVVQSRVGATVMAMTSLMHKALLHLNPNYVMQNYVSGAVNIAAHDNIGDAVSGIVKMFSRSARAEARAAGAAAEHFRKGHELGEYAFEASKWRVPALDKYIDAVDKITDWGSFVEDSVRGAAYHSGLAKRLRQLGRTADELADEGLLEAVQKEVVQAVEFSQHVFGPRGTNPYWRSILGRAGMSWGTHLLTYPMKQVSFLAQGGVKDPGMLMRYFAYTGAATRFLSREWGISMESSLGFGFFPEAVRNVKAGRPPVGPARKGEDDIQSTLRQLGLLSPGNNLLYALFRLGLVAGTGDSKKIDDAMFRLNKAADAVKPLWRQGQKHKKLYEEWHAGKANIGTSFERPLTEKEKIPHLLGLQTVEGQKSFEESREKRALQLEKRNAKLKRKQLIGDYREALTDFKKALAEGDDRGMEDAQERLLKYSTNLRGGDRESARRQVDYLLERLRVLEQSNDFMHPDSPGGL